LGLAIALMAIKQHEGTIHVESQVDHGTSALITIPSRLPDPFGALTQT
jgi:signal transduction histidine kinase